MLHRARDLLMRQRTQLINALRAHMAELGIVAAQGREGVKELLKIIASEQDARLPVDAHASLLPALPGPMYDRCRLWRATPRRRFQSGGAGAELWGLFGASGSKPLAEGSASHLAPPFPRAREGGASARVSIRRCRRGAVGILRRERIETAGRGCARPIPGRPDRRCWPTARPAAVFCLGL